MRKRLSFRKTIAMAFLNLRRQKRRTAITAGAVAVGLALYIFVDSLLLGLDLESERNIIWYETGTAQVIGDGYLAERDVRSLKYPVAEADSIRGILETAGIPAAARTVFSGELIVFQDPFPEDGSVFVTAYGIDPVSDDEVFRMPETLVSGEYIEPGTSTALMGAWLAEDIGADVGYPFTIVTRTSEGYYQTIDLEIAGIVNTPNPIINRTGIFLPRDVANDYLQMGNGATEIAVASADEKNLDDLTSEIRLELAGVSGIEIADWRLLASDAVAIAEVKKSSTDMILFLVFVIAAVGISNTVLMAILERTRELGMMRAMGLRNREVAGLLFVETACIGIMGGLAGIALGAAANLFLVNTGIDYSSILRNADVGYRLTGRMYGAWHPAAYVQALVAGVLISISAALIPVRRAIKMSIVDALHTGKGAM